MVNRRRWSGDKQQRWKRKWTEVHVVKQRCSIAEKSEN